MVFYNQDQEAEAKAQEKERRKESRHAQMMAALQGQATPKRTLTLQPKRDKSHICRQMGHWAQKCPNRDKPPETACYKCHQSGHWLALYPSIQRD